MGNVTEVLVASERLTHSYPFSITKDGVITGFKEKGEVLDIEIPNGVVEIDLGFKVKYPYKRVILRYNGFTLKTLHYLCMSMPDLEYIDLSGMDFIGIESVHSMFKGCKNLKTIVWGKSKFLNLHSTRRLFEGCESLSSIDLSCFNKSVLWDMAYMFKDCVRLKNIIGLENLQISKVKDLSCSFYNCVSLTSLNLSNFDTSSAESMSGLFFNCIGVQSLDLHKFSTSMVKYMGGMFENCIGLTILNISNFDVRNVEDIHFMFKGCYNLKLLNLGRIKYSSIKTTDGVLDGCYNLKEVITSDRSILSLLRERGV